MGIASALGKIMHDRFQGVGALVKILTSSREGVTRNPAIRKYFLIVKILWGKKCCREKTQNRKQGKDANRIEIFSDYPSRHFCDALRFLAAIQKAVGFYSSNAWV